MPLELPLGGQAAVPRERTLSRSAGSLRTTCPLPAGAVSLPAAAVNLESWRSVGRRNDREVFPLGAPLQDQFICQSSLHAESGPSWQPAHTCQLP